MAFKKKPFLCKFCGDTSPENFYTHVEKDGRIRYIKSYCKKCHNKYTWNKKREYKRIIVEEMGGKCSKCGYSKCIAALEFHHPNKDKDVEDWKKLRNRGIEYYREQTKGCLVVCSNCHKEIHYSEEH